ncbi:hypothetical protein EJ110_NYTH58789, partial [Nymphaea thermarum]
MGRGYRGWLGTLGGSLSLPYILSLKCTMGRGYRGSPVLPPPVPPSPSSWVVSGLPPPSSWVVSGLPPPPRAPRRRLGLRVVALCCAPSPRVSCRLLSFAAGFGASSLVLVMAEEIAPKTDVAIDASVAPKSENLPVQVTSTRLTKDNYLSWSAALEIGITSRGRLSYITGAKPAPSKSDPQWENWALEDSQVKVWIISSVSADIQPL